MDRQHHRGLKPKLHHQRLRQYLAGTRRDKGGESVNFKSRHNFNVNANTDIQDAVRTSTVESTTTTREGLLTTTVQRHVSYPLMADFHLWLTGRCSEKQVTTIRSAAPDERYHRAK
jgi:hypothetical protein